MTTKTVMFVMRDVTTLSLDSFGHYQVTLVNGDEIALTFEPVDIYVEQTVSGTFTVVFRCASD